MTEEEWKLLRTPLAQLNKEQRTIAIQLNEKRLNEIAEENKLFKPKPTKSEGPYGVMDSIELKSMADGKTYTSKAKYLAALKADDSHIIESGEHKEGSQSHLRGDYGCKQELKQAIQKHLN